MLKIIRYTFFDLIRSSWSYVYFFFYLLISIVLFFLNSEVSKSVITLMNVIVILTPLIASIFGVMYYYNSEEFITLLLAQPLKRISIFLGQYIGVSISLSLSLLLGLGIPFVFYGVFYSDAIWDFIILLVTGILLNFIFVGLSYNIALRNKNKIKGFSYAILLWLFMAVIYDGIFLISLLIFSDYPLETTSMIATFFNPIDLSRILILLKLDISALMGYTGAVFKKFFNTDMGILISMGCMLLWVVLSVLGISFKSLKKDF